MPTPLVQRLGASLGFPSIRRFHPMLIAHENVSIGTFPFSLLGIFPSQRLLFEARPDVGFLSQAVAVGGVR